MKNIVKILLAVLTGSRACSRSEKRTSLFFSFLIAAFVLSLTPTVYVCAQGHIETPAERKTRQEREAAAKKKRQQDAAARTRRNQASREQEECNERLRSCGKFFKGLAYYKDANGKYGFIDKTGKVVIPCQWEFVESFSEGLAAVNDKDDKYGFIDKTGKLVLPCKWNRAWSFHEGLGSVEDANGKRGYIDKQVRWLYPVNGNL